MKKSIPAPLYFLALLIIVSACGPKNSSIDPPSPNPNDYPVGFSIDKDKAEADQPLIIRFKASPSSGLYGFTGKVYAHIGITDAQGSSLWHHVQAGWQENLPRLEMKPLPDVKNVWQISLSPSVRDFFRMPTKEPIPYIAIVARSADGNKKGLEHDHFIPVAHQQISHAPTQMKPLPAGMQLGINHHDDGKVTFVLDDLDRDGKGYDAGYIMGSFNDWQRQQEYQMYRDPDKSWLWFTIDALDKDQAHKMVYALYSNEKSVRISDPYSEHVQWGIPQAVGAATLFYSVPEKKYIWKYSRDFIQIPKSQLMIYEMHLRDYTPEGNIIGALKRLDYIKALGFNAIELMPIQEFDGDDSWGYNPNHYFAMDQAYGTNVEYKTFIDECHKRGIAVILDIVYNHATAENPFYKLYNQSGKPSKNNPWMNRDAPHPYSVFYDFNHEEPRVRDYFKRNLQFLLQEYKFDGFRFDLTKGFTQKKSNESTASIYDPSRIAILKEYANAAREINPDIYLILEHFCDDREEIELAQEGMMLWRNLNHQYAQAAMGWQEQSSFERLYTPEVSDGWVGYMESHDEERVAYKQIAYGVPAIKNSDKERRKRLETNAAFFFMVPGPKMVWQYGEAAYDHSIDENGRTGRKPIFTDAQLKEVERANLIKTYGRLLELRNKYPEFWALNAPFTWQVSETDWAHLRTIELTTGGFQIKVYGNFNPTQSLNVPIPQGTWYDLMDPDNKIVSSKILLPGEFLLIGNFEVI